MEIFNFSAALPRHTTSVHTQRAYYRWVDRYLADVSHLSPTGGGDARMDRMTRLPLDLLRDALSADQFALWLDMLAQEGHSRQGLDQARAAIVTLSELLARQRLLRPSQFQALRAVQVPPIGHPHTAPVLLSADQLKAIISAAGDIATSLNQQLRNRVVASALCTMALRRDELAAARWGDLVDEDGRLVLRVDGDPVLVTPSMLRILDRWRDVLDNPMPGSPLVRRIWRGGRIASDGLSPDGIWLVVRDSARHAELGHVTPDDLRRSVASGLRDAGASTEYIRDLLRHRNLLVTERFLARLHEVEQRLDAGD